MRYIAFALLALAACGDDSPSVPDAAIDARPDALNAPAIDWSIWGSQCSRPAYGIVTCVANDGTTAGLCILNQDGLSGTCRHYCYSQPTYATECPSDAVRRENASAADGCWCEER